MSWLKSLVARKLTHGGSATAVLKDFETAQPPTARPKSPHSHRPAREPEPDYQVTLQPTPFLRDIQSFLGPQTSSTPAHHHVTTMRTVTLLAAVWPLMLPATHAASCSYFGNDGLCKGQQHPCAISCVPSIDDPAMADGPSGFGNCQYLRGSNVGKLYCYPLGRQKRAGGGDEGGKDWIRDNLELDDKRKTDWALASSSSSSSSSHADPSDAELEQQTAVAGAMRLASRLRDLNPLRLYHHGTRYHRVPDDSPFNLHTYGWPAAAERWCCAGRLSTTKLLGLVVGTMLFLAMVGGGGYRHVSGPRVEEPPSEPPPFFWQNYYPLRGYYNGVRTLVSLGQWEPENRYNQSIPPTLLGNESEAVINSVTGGPSMSPVAFQPYPDYASAAYLQKHQPVHTCYLDAEERVAAPDVYAYPGVPQHMPEAFYGSHKMLGMDDGVCFDRFGRLGPYGYGHEQGGLGNGQASEKAGSEEVFRQVGQINYTDINWGDAQTRCHDKNKVRFDDAEGSHKERVQRHAYILRAWTGYHWSDHQILTTRAMVNELALKSGGEYDVHILLHVKDNSVPIWADQNVYRQTIEENIPREFWNITTLWSEQLMMMYYPEPFPDNFANMAGSNLHGVYRSAHFALQWFSQQRPEYDFYWNWEMDLRYSGHYYEFNTALGDWAKKQPRKGLWERSRRFYFPKHHGDWDNFTKFVEQETWERDIANNDVERSGPVPVWGPVQDFPHTGMMAPPNDTIPPTSYEQDNYEWGVGEEADLITFNPIFDPSLTNWVFSWDMSGYNRSLPIPPRRAAIITVARLSKKLLDIMHEETWRMRHTGFPEMWPPTTCFHHGLKAVYAPQPVYFDRDWALGYMDGVFNYPPEIWESPFGWGEHNLLGSSFYYNSGFSGALWRRWLGMAENGEGGRREEEQGTGRMCLRGTLHHPIKHEAGPMD